MSLEAKIEALTGALTENTAALKAAMAAGVVPSGKGGDAAPAKGGKGAKAAGPTREEVDAAAKAFAKEHGKPAAKALIAKHGGADLASIPEKAWAAFVADTKNPPAAEEPAEDDDGL